MRSILLNDSHPQINPIFRILYTKAHKYWYEGIYHPNSDL